MELFYLPIMMLLIVDNIGIIETGEACFQGWKYYKNNCYKLFSQKRSWIRAREFCQIFQGGDLVQFLKPQELDELDRMDNDEIVWIGLRYENWTWKWIDGISLSLNLSKVLENVKHNATLSECGAFNDSSWTSQNCDEKSSHICQAPTVDCLGPVLLLTPEHHCINVVNSSHGQTWNAAREYCRARGNELATFSHENDIEFLKNLSLSSNHWLGLSYNPDLSVFVWVDGRQVLNNSIANTLTTDPDSACGGIRGNRSHNSSLSWFNGQCTETLKFICESASCASDPSVFPCEQNMCIERNKVCDGHTNCINGADETATLCGLQSTSSSIAVVGATDVSSQTYPGGTLVETTVMAVTSDGNEMTSQIADLLNECTKTNDSDNELRKCFHVLGNTGDSFCEDKTLKGLISAMSGTFREHHNTWDMLKILANFIDVLIEVHDNSPKTCIKPLGIIEDSETFVNSIIVDDHFTQKIEISLDNVELMVTAVDVKHGPKDFHHSFASHMGNVSLFKVPPFQSKLAAENEKVHVITLLYSISRDDEKLQMDDLIREEFTEGDAYIISPILSLNVFQESQKMSVPNSFSLSHDQEKLQAVTTNDSITANTTCAYFDDIVRAWSKKGCAVVQTQKQFTTCKCNHTTNFAILMQVTSIKLEEIHEFALNIITYVGCSVSLITQLITLTVFTCVGSLNSERVYVHRNLCFAIVAAQVSFLAGIKSVQNKIVCACVALILHYFYTSVFVWMLVEGLHLYSKVVQVFGTEKSRVIYYCGFGWGVPLVLVTISAIADWDGYGTPTSCWLSTKKGTIWAFVGPALAVIVVNVVILWMVIRIVMSSAKLENNGEFDHIRAGVKGALFLLPLLGLTWAFGLLAVNEDFAVFQYLFAVFNSLQGFFIFLFHCVCNSEVFQNVISILSPVWRPSIFPMQQNFIFLEISHQFPRKYHTNNVTRKEVRQALRRVKEKRSLQRGDLSSSSHGNGTRTQSWKTKAVRQQKDKEIQYRRDKCQDDNTTSSTNVNSRGSIDSGKQGYIGTDLIIQDLTREVGNGLMHV